MACGGGGVARPSFGLSGIDMQEWVEIRTQGADPTWLVRRAAWTHARWRVLCLLGVGFQRGAGAPIDNGV